MKGKSESEATQSCSTLSESMDYSLPGSSHGIFQGRVLEWVVIAFSSGFFNFPVILITKKKKEKLTLFHGQSIQSIPFPEKIILSFSEFKSSGLDIPLSGKLSFS